MHATAWKLVNDFVSETLPTWDVSPTKTPQGLNHFNVKKRPETFVGTGAKDFAKRYFLGVPKKV